MSEAAQVGGLPGDVVMMTSYGNVPIAVEAMKVGARDFIEKPFEPKGLQAMLEDILQRQTRDAQLSTDPVVSFIQQHATEISSRKDVANRLGVSLERVSARVQEETGLSFRAFLHACRLDLAKLPGNDRTRHLRDLNPHRLPDRAALQPRLQQALRHLSKKVPPAEPVRSSLAEAVPSGLAKFNGPTQEGQVRSSLQRR